jgi:hypothetical protein
LAVAGAALAALAVVAWQAQAPGRPRLLLAPMFNALEPCVQPPHQPVANPPASTPDWCGGNSGSIAPVVETTLAGLGPRLPANPRLELGYTLPIPLLRLLKPQGGDWVVDRPALRKLVRTLQDADRPAVVYLFSTHFGVHAPIEKALAQDPRNLLTTQQGALPVDTYYGDAVYPWNFTSTDNGITRRRLQVIDAFLEEVCRLPQEALQRIRGITLLGELHHMFPKLESGMGYGAPYQITDYSEVSRQDFRQYLKLRFRHIRNLDREVGADFASFADVDPPSKDIRLQPLNRFSEHIDAYAHGRFPVAGWAHLPQAAGGSGAPAWVRVYRNGELIGRTPVRGGRQDVLAAHPEFGTADVGWQLEVDFRALQVGVHRLDILLETPNSALLLLGTRHVAIMGRDQAAPPALPFKALPEHRPAEGQAQWYVDGPAEMSSYFFNPLAALWHEFRGQQVVRYLSHFDQHIRRSCLADTPLYTHQILPFINPGWDRHRFEVDASLRPFGPTRAGVSLYGEATYGADFNAWFKASGLSSYGVTEFHPLKAMSAQEMGALLERHRRRGADFVSFFLEPRGLTPGHGAGPNLFSFDPDVSGFGADALYQATRRTLNQPAAP